MKNNFDEHGILKVKIVPGSSRNEIVGKMANGVLKIRIAAPPEKGKANAELIRFLEKEWGKKIEIISGRNKPLKTLKVGP